MIVDYGTEPASSRWARWWLTLILGAIHAISGYGIAYLLYAQSGGVALINGLAAYREPAMWWASLTWLPATWMWQIGTGGPGMVQLAHWTGLALLSCGSLGAGAVATKTAFVMWRGNRTAGVWLWLTLVVAMWLIWIPAPATLAPSYWLLIRF
jgi:hypothetical protein